MTDAKGDNREVARNFETQVFRLIEDCEERSTNDDDSIADENRADNFD